MINQQEIIEQLTKEGFGEATVYEDKPNLDYTKHTHEKLTVHVIIFGSMKLTDENGIKKLIEGDRYNIPAGTTHSAKIGPMGCKYIVAEK